jgi:hypothetical protein
MRGLTSYLVAGILVVLAVAFAAPAAWLGLPVGARPVVDQGAAVQSVNRTGKADRLIVPMTVIGKTPAVGKKPAVPATIVGKEQMPVKPVKILDGCDPVFSPLSTSAQANLPGRCAV